MMGQASPLTAEVLGYAGCIKDKSSGISQLSDCLPYQNLHTGTHWIGSSKEIVKGNNRGDIESKCGTAQRESEAQDEASLRTPDPKSYNA